MNNLDLFEKCVVRAELNGDYEIQCYLGLWSVIGPNKANVEKEAGRYWIQYYSDGEYDQLLANAPSDSPSHAETHTNAS